MSFLFISKPYSRESKREAVVTLLENTVPDRDFYLLVIGAILLAACGILTDSIPVLIGSLFMFLFFEINREHQTIKNNFK